MFWNTHQFTFFAELLAGEAWSWAAPALARLDPPAFARLASWVHEQLDPAGE